MKYKKFFKVFLCLNIRKFRFRVFVSWNIRKDLFWKNIRIFLILEVESSISRGHKNFFRGDFFYFLNFGIKRVSGSSIIYYFDVALFFTNVPIDFTIDVIIKRIYGNNEIQTNITKAEMKGIRLLCTKGIHFTFCWETFTHTDWVAMGTLLRPVLAGIFMVKLETRLIPTLKDHSLFWKRYTDDTIYFLKTESTSHTLTILNKFHPSIKFTYETKSDNRIYFLDVQLIRKQEHIET